MEDTLRALLVGTAEDVVHIFERERINSIDDVFSLDLRSKKVIPSQIIPIIDVRTAQDHVLAPRGSRDLISRNSRFFAADEEGPRGIVDRWDGPT